MQRLILRKGQTLLELLIALGILGVMLTVTVPLLEAPFRQSPQYRAKSDAFTLAKEGLEAARAIRDRAWTNLTVGVHGVALVGNQWIFQGANDTTSGMTRTLTINETSPTERTVQAAVVWTGSDGQSRSVNVDTLLTNWRQPPPTTQLSGDWSHPRVIGSIDVGAGNQATGLAVRSKFVYLATKASDRAKTDFAVVDATTSSAPVMHGTLNTGPGLNGIAIAGNYAYGANDDESSQLQIISFSNPDAPTLVRSLRLAEDGNGLAVAVQYPFAYVGIEKNSGAEFFVIDVTTSSSPVVRGSVEIGDDVNDIFIYRQRAFLATSKNNGELIVIDITTSTQPHITASADVSGDAENGTAVYVNPQQQRAYLTRTSGSNQPANPELSLFDVTNVDAPAPVGSRNFAYDLNELAAIDNLLFLATSNSNQEFEVYDVTDPTRITFVTGMNLSQVATDMAFEDNLLYVTLRSNDGLQIITSR